MEPRREPYYLGIDLNDRYAMISFFQLNKKEPDTFSTIAGSEHYQIPLAMTKKRGVRQWFYGDEARRLAKNSEMVCVERLLSRAVSKETIRIEEEDFSAEELFFLFMQKLILLPQKLGNPGQFDRLVITVEKLTKENMALFGRLAKEWKLKRDRFQVIDHKESFYYFALNQQRELWMHEVYLFEYEQNKLHYYGLKRNAKTRPQTISILEGDRSSMPEEGKDEMFLQILKNAFANRIVSSVYLVGDGFDGDWMKNSLNQLCKGRRAFIGKNLFSKGACYAARVFDNKKQWEFVYIGENEMKFNLSLKVSRHGETAFYTLINAGENWFENSGECEIILDGTPEINFWKKLPSSREAKIETLELTDLPKRPPRTTRLRICAVPVSDDQVEITIRDLGFGEFFRSTDKIWKYTMSM